MADVSKLTVNGTTYNIKDAQARNGNLGGGGVYPDWSNCIASTGDTSAGASSMKSVTGILKYTATQDCFIVMRWRGATTSTSVSSRYITINNVHVGVNSTSDAYQEFYMPLKKGDVIESTASIQYYYKVYGLRS